MEIKDLLEFPDELDFDISSLPSPAYIIDERLLIRNLELLADVQQRSGAKIILGQKGYSTWNSYPLLKRYLAGTTASSLHELRLGFEEMGGESHIYSPAYRAEEMPTIAAMADYLVFNSWGQKRRFTPMLRLLEETGGKSVSLGLRLNPEYSTQGGGLYDPCAPGSRLGTTARELARAINKQHGLDSDEPIFRTGDWEGIDGLHMHCLCEQNLDDLVPTVNALFEKFGTYIYGLRDAGKLKWLNLGGGHHITRPDYDTEALVQFLIRLGDDLNCQIYLEPGEAIGLGTGYLITEVLDTVRNDVEIAILDASAECHMPDVLAMPYRPHILGSGDPGVLPYTYRLGSATCLAGDVIGDYSFPRPLEPGDRLVLGDMAHYTMVKNNTFNGINLPAICIYRADGQMDIIKTFGYEDYRSRLS